MKHKPNILFLLADDQRFDTIHALGNEEILTPNLDALVHEGTSFSQCHIGGGTCGAVCMPSRGMLHTGRHLFSLVNDGAEIPVNHALMGEVLQDNGYRTFGTGKWHNGIDAYVRSFSKGDEIFFGGMDDHWNVPVHRFDPQGQYRGRSHKVKNYMHSNVRDTFVSDHVHGGKHSTDLFADAAVDFIRQQVEDTPFFAYVSFMAPHDPRTMPDGFLKMYQEKTVTLPPNFMAMHPIEYGNTQCRDELLAPYPRTPEDTVNQIKEYYGMITHLDQALGRVVEALKACGQYENTVIIYSGDNGLALGQHGLFGKQCVYDHSIRVPLIMSGPGIPKDRKINSLLYLADVFPTLCDYLDVNVPSSVEGKSFLNCLEEKDSLHRDRLYLAYKDKIRGIKNDRYKLMVHVHKGHGKVQLFDLMNDPWERKDLSLDEAFKQVKAELLKLLEEEGQRMNDTSLTCGMDFWRSYNKCIKASC